jgi:hypothetical protein
MPIIPALRRWGKEDHKFYASLGYIRGPCLKSRGQGEEPEMNCP